MTAQVKQTGRMEADQVAAAAAARDAQQQAVAVADVVLADAAVSDAVTPAATEDSHRQDAAAVAASAGEVHEDDAAAVVAEAVLPTSAPAAMTIGDLAQATTGGTTTDAPAAESPATDAAAAPTDVPAEGSEAGAGWNPWLVGGLAVLGVAGIAAAADSGGSSSSPPPAGGTPTPAPTPAPTPTPTPTPAPTPPADPNAPTGLETGAYTRPDGVAAAGLYFADTNNNNTVDAGERVVFHNATSGHYYELVASAGSWDAANTAAAAKGGHLLVINDATEAAYIQSLYGYEIGGPSVEVPADRAANYAGNRPIYGGLPVDELGGDQGAWVGLQANGTGWNWVAQTSGGATTAITNTDPLWIVHYGQQRPSSAADDQRGAIVGGNNLGADSSPAAPNPAETQVLFNQIGGTALPYYVVEYETLAAVNTPAPAAPVSLDSLTGVQLASAPAVTDALPATVSGISLGLDQLQNA